MLIKALEWKKSHEQYLTMVKYEGNDKIFGSKQIFVHEFPDIVK